MVTYFCQASTKFKQAIKKCAERFLIKSGHQQNNITCLIAIPYSVFNIFKKRTLKKAHIHRSYKQYKRTAKKEANKLAEDPTWRLWKVIRYKKTPVWINVLICFLIEHLSSGYLFILSTFSIGSNKETLYSPRLRNIVRFLLADNCAYNWVYFYFCFLLLLIPTSVLH